MLKVEPTLSQYKNYMLHKIDIISFNIGLFQKLSVPPPHVEDVPFFKIETPLDIQVNLADPLDIHLQFFGDPLDIRYPISSSYKPLGYPISENF